MQYCKVVASGMTSANIEVIAKQISYISLKQINKLKSAHYQTLLLQKEPFTSCWWTGSGGNLATSRGPKIKIVQNNRRKARFEQLFLPM